MKRAAIVLCGGQSRRMGRPKALLPWFGRTMIEHVLATLEGCVDERIVVTSEALSLGALALAARIVVDREPARGPLAALRDGLEATTAEQVFVTACDSPFLTVEHVEALFDRARTGSGAAAPVDEGIVQVLSAVYPGGAGREAAALLAAGISSPTALLERIGFDAVGRDASGSAHARPGAAPWTGFNTPEAYLALARRRDPAATALVEWRREDAIGGAETDVGRDGARAIGLGTVPIGRLDEVLERAVPPDERLANGTLRVVLAEGELAPDADGGLPIGPGEIVRVHESPRCGSR